MKKLMFAFCFLFGGFVAVNAQDTISAPRQTPTQYPSTLQEDDRQRINSRDLPDGIKRSLETQDFRGWLINSAYITSDNGSQQDKGNATGDTTSVSDSETPSAAKVYVVELKNGAQTRTVRFDKEGKKLDDDGMGIDRN